jgi:hypothetical protein
MLVAVHRRDHRHAGRCCSPHEVEVVHLGPAAVAVCHDCGFESELLPGRESDRAAGGHRAGTALSGTRETRSAGTRIADSALKEINPAADAVKVTDTGRRHPDLDS